jgi:uncharacterized caspase-like protein
VLNVLRAAVIVLLIALFPSQARADGRIALLIGNEAYATEIGRLANPHNDVALLERTLKGLGFPVAQENGMLIAYSTAEGELASDVGAGAGPYATVLAEEIVKPGTEAVNMFRDVQRRVRKAIGQEPYLGFSALGDVFLGGRADVAVPQRAPPLTPDRPPTIGAPTYEQQAAALASDWWGC